jgi:hypothetical protein
MKIKATISMKNNDTPKITLGAELMGSHQVTFDLYEIDPTTLLSLVGKELELSVMAVDEIVEVTE